MYIITNLFNKHKNNGIKTIFIYFKSSEKKKHSKNNSNSGVQKKKHKFKRKEIGNLKAEI